MKGFSAFRAKTYTYLMDDDIKKKAKGVKTSAIKRRLMFETLIHCSIIRPY